MKQGHVTVEEGVIPLGLLRSVPHGRVILYFVDLVILLKSIGGATDFYILGLPEALVRGCFETFPFARGHSVLSIILSFDGFGDLVK